MIDFYLWVLCGNLFIRKKIIIVCICFVLLYDIFWYKVLVILLGYINKVNRNFDGNKYNIGNKIIYIKFYFIYFKFE